MDPIKYSREKVAKPFSHYKSMGIFQTLKGSLLRSRWSDLAEFRTPPSSHACNRYLQVFKGLGEKRLRKSSNTVFSIITRWELSFFVFVLIVV